MPTANVHFLGANWGLSQFPLPRQFEIRCSDPEVGGSMSQVEIEVNGSLSMSKKKELDPPVGASTRALTM